MTTATIVSFIVVVWKAIEYWLTNKTTSTKLNEKVEQPVKANPEVLKEKETQNDKTQVQETTKPIEIVKIVEVKEEPKTTKVPDKVPSEKLEEKIIVKKPKQNIQLVVKRTTFTPESTIGELFIDNKFICYTLEDVDRKLEEGGKKIYCETAIPRGTYEVILSYSPSFEKVLPEILQVPQYQYIRIHSGNFANPDSCGCLLLGFHKSENMIQNSREAVKFVIETIAEKLKKEKVYIQIK